MMQLKRLKKTCKLIRIHFQNIFKNVFLIFIKGSLLLHQLKFAKQFARRIIFVISISNFNDLNTNFRLMIPLILKLM